MQTETSSSSREPIAALLADVDGTLITKEKVLVTHPDANKGAVVERLARYLKVPAKRIATIGDQQNDVLMFEKSGLSIAMGNASPEVQRRADCVTTSCGEEGFASAVERFVLSRM